MVRSIVIVGGGLIGLSAAFHLRRADPGTRVTVLKRLRVGAAASGASAAGVRVMGRDPAERALALESRPVPGIDGLLVAAGFSGHGFALVPVVGDVLARLALGVDPLRHLWSGLGAGRVLP